MDRDEMAREIQRMHDENARAKAEMEQHVANHNREMARLAHEAHMIVVKAMTESLLALHQPQKRITVAM